MDAEVSVGNIVRAFVCGMTGSGKSQCVRDFLLSHHRRIIVVDPIGDYPDAEPSYTVGELLTRIRENVYRGRTSWMLSACIGREQIGELADALVPPVRVSSSFVKAIGGACVVLEESDLLTPRGQGGEQIAGLFRRGRHVGLSAIAVTQRPANVSKETIAQASLVIAYRVDSPADRAYLEAHCGRHMVETCVRAWQQPFAAVAWSSATGRSVILGPDYQIGTAPMLHFA